MRDSEWNPWRIVVNVSGKKEEELSEDLESIDSELKEIFKIFDLEWVEINNAETEIWKQEALKELMFTEKKIEKLNLIIEKIVNGYTTKYQTKYWYKGTLTKLQKKLEWKKWKKF